MLGIMMRREETQTYVLRLLLGHEMSGASEENVRPVALLMHDSRKRAIVTEPRG